MKLLHVPATHVDQAWKDGASKLAEACATSGGEVTGDQLKLLLARGERTLIQMNDNGAIVGWGVMRIDQLPNVRVLHICEVYAPRNLHGEYLAQLKELAKAHGCSEIRCSAKPAQARLYRMKFDFESVYETMRVLC